MKDLLCLALVIAAICFMHAGKNNQLNKNNMKLAEPKSTIVYYTWPGIQTESAGSRDIYKVGNKKHNQQHQKPQYSE